MPVYNEESSIEDVVQSWTSHLDRLAVNYEFLIFDDGSKDGTGDVLRALAANHAAIAVHHHGNVGHGPTILRGYREARGEWVFQADSDGEMDAGAFENFWHARDSFDFILGSRTGRDAPWVRRLITATSSVSVAVLFGRGVRDVNSPYRLMRGSWLRSVLTELPPDLFAPNVVLSGLAVRSRARIREVAVRHQNRRHGKSSLAGLKALKPALRSFLQTWRISRSGESRRPR